jgi:hypothetical protein
MERIFFTFYPRGQIDPGQVSVFKNPTVKSDFASTNFIKNEAPESVQYHNVWSFLITPNAQFELRGIVWNLSAGSSSI